VQKGAFRVNRRGSLLIRPGRIEFVIEKPIATQGYGRENIAELMGKVRGVFLQYVE
jgi:hypothetical protein